MNKKIEILSMVPVNRLNKEEQFETKRYKRVHWVQPAWHKNRLSNK